MDYNSARQTMVDTQLRPDGVSDQRLVDAFLSVPREHFVKKADLGLAYGELELETSAGRSLWIPRDTGKLIDIAEPGAEDIVLVVGAGTGYEAALLSRLTNAVIALDDFDDFTESASNRFAQIGADNVVGVQGDLAEGFPSEGPYDLIFVCGMIQEPSKAWFDQLAEGGRLAAAVEVQKGLGRGRVYKKSANVLSFSEHFDLTPPKFQQFDRETVFSF